MKNILVLSLAYGLLYNTISSHKWINSNSLILIDIVATVYCLFSFKIGGTIEELENESG